VTLGYVIVFIGGFFATCWGDRKELKQAKKAEKVIYWGLALCAFASFVCSYTNVHVPMPTELVVYRIAPWFHQITQNLRS
jgi:MFS family permease